MALTTLLSESFTGVDGDSPPIPFTYTFIEGTTGGAVDIQSNRLRIRPHDGSWRRVQVNIEGITLANGRIEFTFRFPNLLEKYAYIWFRSSEEWHETSHYHKVSGYFFSPWIADNESDVRGLTLARVDNGDSIDLDEISAFEFAVDTDYYGTIDFSGSTLTVTIRDAPGGTVLATLSADDSTYTEGVVASSLLSGGGSGNDREWFIDDLVIQEDVPETSEPDSGSDWSSFGDHFQAWVNVPTEVGGTNWRARINLVHPDEITRAVGVWNSLVLGEWNRVLADHGGVSFLNNVGRVEVEVSAEGVNGTAAAIIDHIQQGTYGGSDFPGEEPVGSEGLLWNATMLTAWQSRWVAQDTYWATGDEATNSPGDGSRIDANANAFRSGTTQPWEPTTSPFQQGEGDRSQEGLNSGFNFRDCAFRYLMTGDTGDRDACKAHLLAEIRQDWFDVTNSTWWPQTQPHFLDINPLFIITELWSRYMSAYAFLGTDSFTSAENTEIQSIFENCAHYVVREFNASGYLGVFVDRAAGTIESTYDEPQVYNGSSLAYVGGPDMPTIAHFMNNRRMTMARFVGLVAGMWGNLSLVDTTKNQIIDFVRFGLFPDGTLSDFYRENASFKDLGWQYSAAALSDAVEMATALYFGQGDAAMLDYTSNVGATTGPTSGPMNDGTSDDGQAIGLKQGMKALCKYVDANIYSRTGVRSGGQINGGENVHECSAAIGNVYWNDAYIASVIDRTATGVGGWGSSPGHSFEGTGRAYPGILFMFGGLEGSAS